jgi:spore coat polysaccharide biosynthesis protein SpsF
MGSTRLPGKVLADVGGRPMLALMLERLGRSRLLDEVCVATSTLERDAPIEELCATRGVWCVRGPESDVLERFRQAVCATGADVVVRLTADCPLICPEVVDCVLQRFLEATPPADYARNCLRRTFPRGLDTEVVSRRVLDLAAAEASESPDREHVTCFVWRQPDRFRLLSVEDVVDRSGLRWTVDTPEDLELVRHLADALGDRAAAATYAEILSAFGAHPEWAGINALVEQKGIGH